MKISLLSFLFLFTSAFAQNIDQSKILKLEHDSKKLSAEQNNPGYKAKFKDEFHKKNVGLAVLYSLLLPGMGELYAESYSSGKYFTIADAALWGVYFGMNYYGNNKKDDYQAYAASNGSVNNSGKDDKYYATIGIYSSIEEYNNAKALERNFDQMYDTEKFYWKWETNDERKTYRNLWTSSESAFNNLRFLAGALILNRVVSVINAIRLVSKYNKSRNTELSWDMSVGIENKLNLPTSFNLKFQTEF